jgi:hypothetical protein
VIGFFAGLVAILFVASIISTDKSLALRIDIEDAPMLVKSGELVVAKAMVVNETDERIRILGTRLPCNCSSLLGLPATIGGRETATIQISHTAPVVLEESQQAAEFTIFHSRGDHVCRFSVPYIVMPGKGAENEPLVPIPDPTIR